MELIELLERAVLAIEGDTTANTLEVLEDIEDCIDTLTQMHYQSLMLCDDDMISIARH